MADYCPITVARFWSKVEVSAGKKECWTWRASTDRYGYGKFRPVGCRTGMRKAHRVAWEIFNGQALGDSLCLHSCDNPLCCNPHHLRPGTQADNISDIWDRGRQRFGDHAGERNPRALLTQADVDRIRERIAAGETNRAIAADYPVSEGMVSRIKLGLSWNKPGTGNGQNIGQNAPRAAS